MKNLGKLFTSLCLIFCALYNVAAEKDVYSSLKDEIPFTPDYYDAVQKRKIAVSPAAAKEAISLGTAKQKIAALRNEALTKLEQTTLAALQIDKTIWQEAEKIKAEPQQIEKLLAGGLNLDFLIALSLLRHPGLAAAFKQRQAIINEYSQVDNLQDILNQYASFSGLLSATHNGPMANMAYPFPGMLALRGDIIQKEIDIAANDYLMKALGIVAATKSAYFELAYLEEEEKLFSETLEIITALKDISQALFTTGKTNLNDVINMQIEIDKLSNELVSNRKKQETVKLRLVTYLNLQPLTTLGNTAASKPVSFAYQLSELYKSAEANSPELRKMRLELDKMQLMVLMLEREFYPAMASNASYFDSRKVNLPADKAETMAMGGNESSALEAPAPAINNNYGLNDAYIKQLQDEYQAMSQELTAVSNDLNQQIREMFLEIDTAQRNRQLFLEVIIPQAKQLFELSQTGYQAGKVDFSELLRSYNTWLDYQREYYMAVKEMNQGISALEKMIGQSLKNGEGQ